MNKVNFFLHAMVVLGYLPKIRRGVGLSFGTHFLCGFSNKWALFNSQSVYKVSMT